ncbi:MaoC/PaaZ C-terminal domain-containing protein [Nocardia sp. NBC_01377]|uniref:hypothetical protein n=1 Tax=Nocardia sp. NBC_01377 TaxID=2903595 RepID=UPI003253E21D
MTDNALSQIAPGQRLPEFVRQSGLATWNRYAAVNYEFVDIHMDDEAGRAAGFESAFGMGNLLWSYLHCLLRQWMNGRGRILRLSCQFRQPATKSVTAVASATVTAVRTAEGGREVDLDVWIKDQDGNRLAPGTATVLLYD